MLTNIDREKPPCDTFLASTYLNGCNAFFRGMGMGMGVGPVRAYRIFNCLDSLESIAGEKLRLRGIQ